MANFRAAGMRPVAIAVLGVFEDIGYLMRPRPSKAIASTELSRL
jgi:hypothetical protein